MPSDRYLELGIFGMNAVGGIAMTKVPERWQIVWQDILKVSKFADKNDFDFLLPIGRWRGYGGETNPAGAAYETFSFAACLTGVTEKIKLFSTVHVPYIHPVYAARSAATIDHASNGRFNLNIVCGWSLEEFQMFGLSDYNPDDRYIQGNEWTNIFEGLLSEQEYFNYDGKFYQVKEGVCLPKTIQQPRPLMLSAAFSPAGREFAITKCDILFTMFSDLRISRRQNLELLDKAKSRGKHNTQIYTSAHVVCRQTQREAEDYYDYYAETEADVEAAEAFAGKMALVSPKIGAMQKSKLKRIAGGAGTVPIVGSPDYVAEQLIAVRDAKFSGIGMSFVDYGMEVPYFAENVMPLLKKAGVHR